MVAAVVVSLVELIGYHLFRKPKPKFALGRLDHTPEAVASSLEHSHALNMLNGQRTQCIHPEARRTGSNCAREIGDLAEEDESICRRRIGNFAKRQRNAVAPPSHTSSTSRRRQLSSALRTRWA
jgi:hypothetical protein